MGNFTNTPLFKSLVAIFLFIVLTSALGSIIVDHYLQIPDDPRIINILTVGLGYCFSQLGNFQGANTVTNSINAISNPTTLATRENTTATEANTQAIKDGK